MTITFVLEALGLSYGPIFICILATLTHTLSLRIVITPLEKNVIAILKTGFMVIYRSLLIGTSYAQWNRSLIHSTATHFRNKHVFSDFHIFKKDISPYSVSKSKILPGIESDTF